MRAAPGVTAASCATLANIYDHFKPGEVYNIGGGKVIELNRALEIIADVLYVATVETSCGAFEIERIAPGEYRLLATRPGFVMSAEDRGSPDPASAGRAVAVGESAVLDDVEFVRE